MAMTARRNVVPSLLVWLLFATMARALIPLHGNSITTPTGGPSYHHLGLQSPNVTPMGSSKQRKRHLALSRSRSRRRLSFEDSFKNSKHHRRRFVKVFAMGLATLLLVPLRATASTVAVVEPIVAATEVAVVATEVASTAAAAVAITAPPVSAAVEMQLSIRLVYAALMGAILGKERSLAKHSAGVRTMALVAMGASAFTVCSAYGFANFGHYDPSRMASNVASGVGFVGAGVITTTANRSQNVVHGLTTAVTIWLSAAVGVACGVGLFGIATTASLTTIVILRWGRIKPPNHKKITKATTAVPRSNSLLSKVLEKVGEMSAAEDTASEMTMVEEEEEDDHDDYAEIHDTSDWDEQPNIQKNSTESQQSVPTKQRMTFDGDHGMQVVVEKAWKNYTQEA